MRSDPTIDTDSQEQREEMQRLIRQCLGLISRGAPDGAAECARRAAELGKRIGRRWHREPKVPSERQGVLPFERGWTWAGNGQADRALQRAVHADLTTRSPFPESQNLASEAASSS
jgi:hypothetical protein